jgi:hypothetical protein
MKKIPRNPLKIKNKKTPRSIIEFSKATREKINMQKSIDCISVYWH